MNYNFKNKDTLEVFNERWNVNHKKIDKQVIKNNIRNSNTPSFIAKRITNNINAVRNNENNKFMSRFK